MWPRAAEGLGMTYIKEAVSSPGGRIGSRAFDWS